MGVHKYSSPLSHHLPGQSVRRLNTPLKESQWSQQWAYNNDKVCLYVPSNQKTVNYSNDMVMMQCNLTDKGFQNNL